MVFMDLERGFYCVISKVIWRALRRKGVMERENKSINEMYRNVSKTV